MVFKGSECNISTKKDIIILWTIHESVLRRRADKGNLRETFGVIN